MNGIVEVNAGGKKTVLRFGYIACMEFEKLIFKNATQNSAKVFTDLIYSGLLCEAVRNEKAIPDYGVAYDLLEVLTSEEDYNEQTLKIWNTYNESKWGQDFQKRLNELNTKKKEDSEEVSQ